MINTLPDGFPEPSDGPVRLVIDTDAANEIDDQFALAWALLAPERLRIEAIHAAPYGHGDYFASLLAAATRREGAFATAWEELAVLVGADQIAQMIATHPPAEGMEASFAEIERVIDAASPTLRPPVKRGSERFMADATDAVPSEAASHLIDLVHASDEPLYVAIMGAPTNVASALLADPSIAAKLVAVFVAGFPSASPHVDDSFNLIQDRHASARLFAPSTNLVYLPGYQVAETLSVSLPDVERHVQGHGPLGDLLYQLYVDNPMAAAPDRPGHSWVMWDLAPLAWLIDPTWVRTFVAAGATIGENHHWTPSAGQHLEAFRIDRRAVYTDLFARFEHLSEVPSTS